MVYKNFLLPEIFLKAAVGVLLFYTLHVLVQKASWWERLRKKKQNEIEHFEEQRFGINGHFAKIYKVSSFIFDAKMNYSSITDLIISLRLF